jgi:hypothetical protein
MLSRSTSFCAQHSDLPDLDMTTAVVRSRIKSQVIALLEALAQTPGPDARRFGELLRQRSLSVEVFSPRDPYKPPAGDLVYMVVQGSGELQLDQNRISFGLGDFIFVPSDSMHRFVRYSDDVVIWVIFYN